MTDFYAALASLRPSGAPADAQRAALSPLLSAELIGLLQRADAARALARAAAPTEKPPFTDGDLFSSLFEGPTGYAVGKPVTWTDTVLLREENGRFVVADIAFGGDWDFANKGSMLAALHAGLGEKG